MSSIFQFLLTGSHTGVNHATILTDSSGDFVNQRVQTGDIIYNVTDNSYGVITTVTDATHLTMSAGLIGGTSNIWTTNDTYRIWVSDPHLVRFTVIDVLWFPMVLKVTIGNPGNTAEPSFSDYQKVRILEDNTKIGPLASGNMTTPDRVLFYGKITEISPRPDDAYGQVLVIEAWDNLQELLKRTINKDYFKSTRRDQVIQDIIEDYSYAANYNINTLDTIKFENSDVAESTGILDLRYSGKGKNALRVIAELSQEDPWDAIPTGFGFDGFLDTEFDNSGGPTPDLHYFQRGERPIGAPATYGLTIELEGTATDQLLPMLPEYAFPLESRERITRATIDYADESGGSQSIKAILLDLSSMSSNFTVGNTLTGGTSGATAVVEYSGFDGVSTGFLIISTYILTGTHDTGNNAASLVDSGTNFISLGVHPGLTVRNTTDGSSGVITSITTTTNPDDTIVATLAGGTDDDWDIGDAYSINDTPRVSGTHNGGAAVASLVDTTTNFVSLGIIAGQTVINDTDGSSGTIIAITTTTNLNDTIVATLAGGAGNNWDPGDTYIILTTAYYDWFGNFTIGETITEGANTATINIVPRQSLEQDNERHIVDFNITNITEAQKKLAQALYHSSSTIERGEVSIYAWPFYRIDGTHTGANGVAVLTDAAASFINYGIMPGDVVRNITDGSNAIVTARTANTITGALMDGTNNDWDTNDEYEIYLLVRAGQRIRVVNTNVSGLPADMIITKITYDEGPAMQRAQIQAKKLNYGMGGYIQPFEALREADETNSTTNIVRSGSGTTRVELNASGLYGYNIGVAQFYLLAADGKAYFAAGRGVFDSATGLKLTADVGLERMITFANANGDIGAIYGRNAGAGDHIVLVADAGKGFAIEAGGGVPAPAANSIYISTTGGSGGDITFSSDDVLTLSAATLIITATTWSLTGDVLPSLGSTYDLGAAGTTWQEIYGDTVFTDILDDIAGTGVSIAADLIPSGAFDLGSVANAYAEIYGTTIYPGTLDDLAGGSITIATDLIPNGAFDLGSGANAFAESYVTTGYFGTLDDTAGGSITIATSLIPNGAFDLGSGANPFAESHITTGYFTTLDDIAGGSIAIATDLIPNGAFDLGSAANPYTEIRGTTVYVGTLEDTGGGSISTGGHLIPTGAHNLGSGANSFATIYIDTLGDFSGIAAGSPTWKVTATTDVPGSAWGVGAGYEIDAAPDGWIEIDVGGVSKYVPFWP